MFATRLMLPLRLRRGSERVLGPGVLRVTRAQVLANLEVGRRPEAAQVVRDLHGTEIRRQQVQQDRHPSARDARRVGPAEYFLQAHRQHGRLQLAVRVSLLEVLEADAAPAGNWDRL